MNPGFPPNPATGGPFSQIDLEQMPEAPNRGSYHRRAHSDTFFRLPDDLLFDVDFSSLDLPPNTNAAAAINSSRTNQLDTPMALGSCRSEDSAHNFKTVGTTGKPPPPVGHFRSLSVDASADFFEGMLFDTAMCDDRDSGSKSAAADASSVSEGRRLGLHRRNNSMDGTSSSFEADSFVDGVKKVMTPDKLAELALLDPKRAKKILANRQSAARSKERKVRYTGELERKVQTLQTEATTLSTQVTMLQRDTSGLTSENRELKLRLQAMEQQAHLKDALNETLREEVQRLRITASQNPSPNSNAPNRSSNPFSIQQAHPQPSNNEQNSSKQLWPSFLDFNHRVQ